MSKNRKKRRKKKMFGSSERPRLVVYRSLKNIYAQIVDDEQQKTLLGGSTLSKELADKLKKAESRVEASRLVGEFIAQKALEKKIKKVVFDRNGYKYHGRVKALAEGARKAGLEF